MAVERRDPEGTSADPTVTRFREYIAGGLAVVIVVSTVALMIAALVYVRAAEDDGAFQRVKDLLLFINPLLGVVIGYYFNKASTEARAESAEKTAQVASSTAQVATATAQQAAEARDEAQAEVAEVEAVAAEQKAVLTEVSELSGRLLEQAGTSPGTLGLEGSSESEALMRELRAALGQARRVLARS
jgi:hypothetical protein